MTKFRKTAAADLGVGDVVIGFDGLPEFEIRRSCGTWSSASLLITQTPCLDMSQGVKPHATLFLTPNHASVEFPPSCEPPTLRLLQS